MDLKHKKIVIWGLGVTGRASFDFLQQFDCKLVGMDQKCPDWFPQEHFAQESFDLLADCDLLIKSPGIPWRKDILRDFPLERVMTDLDLAAQFTKVPLVGISGTNGKTSTVTFLAQAFREQGLKVFEAGNIGTSLLRIDQKSDLAVLELSSFQLETFHNVPLKAGALLNISPSHEERYKSFEDYRKAKLKLAQDSTEKLFFYQEDWPELSHGLDRQEAQSFEFGLELPKHLKENFYLAYRMFKQCGGGDKAFKRALKKYQPLPHRLEVITQRPMTIINDSKSTNRASVERALETFGAERTTLLIGGQCRNLQELEKWKDLKAYQVLVFGEVGECLKENYRKVELDDLPQLLSSLKTEVLLFSPGFPSFDRFKNYEERGEYFKSLFQGKT